MSYTQYWVGQVPALPLVINVFDSMGNVLDCSIYDTFKIRLLDKDNLDVDLTGSTLTVLSAKNGQIVFYWPKTSVFKYAGDYIMQLQLSKADGSAVDFTSTYTFTIKDLGGRKDNVFVFGSSIYDYGL